MTLRRAAGFTALGSGIAMIAVMVAMVVQIARASEPTRGGTIGVIALAEPGATNGIMLPDHHFAVLQELGARWELQGLRAVTVEAIEDLPVVVVLLRRRLSYHEAIDLDAWVRGGGRALVFAEPDRSWPGPASAIDENLRESTWSLRLVPRPDGPVALPGGGTLMLNNAGRWVASEECGVMVDGLLADCRPGKGRALLIADTGLLDRNPLDLAGGGFDSATGMTGQLIDALERGTPVPERFVAGSGEYVRAQPPMMLMLVSGALFWLTLGSLIVWAVLLGARGRDARIASGPARIVRTPDGATE